MIGPQASIAETYELVWRGDPALDVADADFEHKWQQANDGMLPWQALCKPGVVPTVFVMRTMPGSKFRRLVKFLDGAEKGAADDCALMFRVSLLEIKNDSSIKVAHVRHQEIGIDTVSDKVIDHFDAIDRSIVTELGTMAFHRMVLPPKR
jgi:hypothetical protein